MPVEERKYFLARRPKGKPVKGVTRPPKKTSDKILLVGDSESESVRYILMNQTGRISNVLL